MNRKMITALLLSYVLLPGCAAILGSDETALQEAASGPRLAFEETLKSRESLQGEGLRENVRPAVPAESLQRPVGVFADAFRVYVTDDYIASAGQSARVFIFDRGERKLSVLDGVPDPPEDAVKLITASAVAVDATGVIFVADPQQGKVFGYDRNGAQLMVIGRAGELSSPTGLAVDRERNRLYIADPRARTVRLFTGSGSLLRDIGRTERPEQELSAPTALAIDRTGALYVLDSRARRVQVYDPEGVFLRAFGITGETPGAVVRPKGIAVDSLGRVYVSDSVMNAILIFDGSGKLIKSWGRSGSLAGDFLTPLGIFIDRNDTVYVVDQSNSRVQVFRTLP